MKRILFIIFCLSLALSSCSGKKYGHYRFSKKQKHTIVKHKSQNAKKVKNITPKHLSATNQVVSQNKNSDSVKSETVPQKPHTQRVNSIAIPTKNSDTLLKKQNYKAPLFLEQSSAAPEKPKKNKDANLAFILSLVGLGVSLVGIVIPFIGLLGLILVVLGFIFGLIALSEIKKNPGMYSNRGEAITAVVIGAIYLALLVIAILLTLLLFVLLSGL